MTISPNDAFKDGREQGYRDRDREVERLRAALQPFANMLDGREHLDRHKRTEVTYADLWKAREALE